MLLLLKYAVVILFICGFCNGENIQKCFGLNKIKPTNGNAYYHWEQRNKTLKVNLFCHNGHIRFGNITFSIPKDDMCNAETCEAFDGFSSCDCCNTTFDPTHVCNFYPSAKAYRKVCELRKICSFLIGIQDLREHCVKKIDYPCEPGWCKSRWLEVNYDCVPGMDINFLYQ